MLSTGKHHLHVPRERKENLRFRKALIERCRNSPKHQDLVRKACAEDILFYINTFVWQFNPRKKAEGAVGPFITWGFQDEALVSEDIRKPGILWCIEHDEDLFIEKSREMGASWLCLLAMEWLWHWKPWQKFLCMSRNEDLVDDDDPDSLFWKIDFAHRHMPAWLMPRGWNAKLHRKHLIFINPENNSTITGEASTGKAGVGGRATAMFIDEFSQVQQDYDVLHRTSDTTGCRIFNGTHKGTGTAFHELSQRVDIKKLVMHWTSHPDKWPGAYRWRDNKVEILDKTYAYPEDFKFVQSEAPAGGPCPGIRSPWYDNQCRRKGSPRAIAEDLDIDPGGSVAQFFNPVTIRVLVETYCHDPRWVGEVEYDRDSGQPGGLVKVDSGRLRLWVQPKADGTLPRGRYGAGADLSTGYGATNSCLSIVSGETGEKVAEYATPHISPENIAPLFLAICWLFKTEDDLPAFLIWEHHGPGLMFGKQVLTIGYPHFYWREADQVRGGGRLSKQPGWYPSNDTKRILLDSYRAALEHRRMINRSEFALKECLHYRYTPQGTVEHPMDSGGEDHTGARVNHGDMTMADALAWKAADKYGVMGGKKASEHAGVQVGSLAWRRMLAEEADGGREDEA